MELLIFGENLKFKNWPFFMHLEVFETIIAAILQTCKHINSGIFYSTTVQLRTFNGTINFGETEVEKVANFRELCGRF